MIDGLEKYIGRTVEIIYMDRHQKITQRKVIFRLFQNNKINAFCLERFAPRVFLADNILAVATVTGRRTG